MSRQPLHPGRRVRPGWLRVVAGALIVSGGAVIGLSVSAYGSSTPDAPHIMVVMMENESQSELIGNADAPNTNALAQEYGSATQSYAVGHPSLPNYLELLAGSEYGVTSDTTPSSAGIPSSAQTLVDQLEAAGISWRAYLEDMPSAGYTGDDTGGLDAYGGDYYLQHHNPFVYFPAVTSLSDFADNMLPLSTNVTSDLNSASPPDFVWVTPNAVDDMHDGPTNSYGDVNPSLGDAWLGNFVSQVQSTTWYSQGGNIIIEWDEGMDSDTSGIGSSAESGGGHIVTIDVSAALKANPKQDSTPVNTAGILHSIEGVYGLPYLADAADTANGNIDALLGVTSPSATTTMPTEPPTPTTTAVAPPTTVATGAPTPTTLAPTTAVPTTTKAPTTKTTAAPTIHAPVKTTTAHPATTKPKADPPATTTTVAGVRVKADGSSGGSSDPSVVSAPSSALAFTGFSNGMRTLGVVGGGLVLLGFALLSLVGVPRRSARRLAFVDTNRLVGEVAGAGLEPAEAWRNDLWLVPPS
jgi:phosphatidylinositol-3-phosphatase